MDKLVFPTVTHNYLQIPIWLARECGVFAEQNLDIEIRYEDRSSDYPAELVREGKARIATIGVEHMLVDREKGGDLVAIAGNVNKLPFSLIVQPAIRSFADLRGKTIGVSSLKFGTSAIIPKLCEAHGLARGDYKLFEMGPIEKRWAMLRSGEIDGGLQAAPMNFVALDAGFKELGRISDVFPQFQFSSLFVSRAWGEANRDIVVRFLRAFLKAIEVYYRDGEKVAQTVGLISNLFKGYEDRAREEYIRNEVLPRDGRVSLAGVKAVIDMSADIRGVVARADADPADFVDHSYLEEARRTLK